MTHDTSDGPFQSKDSEAHQDPSTSSASSPPNRPKKVVSRNPDGRRWYQEKEGKYELEDEDKEVIDVLNAVTTEISCTEDVARKLFDAGLVRVLDHHEIPALSGHYATPGSVGIAYRCRGTKRLEDLSENADIFCDADGNAKELQGDDVWRVKLLNGSWAEKESNDGWPIFTPRSSQPKYLSPRGSPACSIFLPTAANPRAYDHLDELWLPEGEKKAVLLAQAGIAAASIPGVANWGYGADLLRQAVGTGSTGGTLAPGLVQLLKDLGVRRVVVAFDSPDVYDNPQVQKQAGALAVALSQAGVESVGFLILPRPPSGGKWGADDWLVAHPGGQKIRRYVVDDDYTAKQCLEAADERAEALLALWLARSRARKASGLIMRGSACADTEAVVRKLKLNNERQVLEVLKEMDDEKSRLRRAMPELWARLNERYRYTERGGGTVYRYEQDNKLTVYTRCPDSDTGAVSGEVYDWVKKELNIKLAPKQVFEVEKEWRLAQQHERQLDLDEVLPCQFRYVEGSAYVALPTPESGSMPAWEEFLSRLGDARDTFLSWVGSALDMDNRGREILYLEGNGNDGKSVVARALATMFGAAAAKLPDFIDQENKHLTSILEGVRFAFIPESKQAKLLQQGVIRAISGGDRLTIDRKGRDAYESDNYVRLLICSNNPPEIGGGKSDTSRLVWLTVDDRKSGDRDESWFPRLVKELPQLVHAAMGAYRKAKKGVWVSPETASRLEEAVDLGTASIRALFDEHLVMDPSGFLSVAALQAVADRRGLGANEVRELRSYLLTLDGVKRKKERVAGAPNPVHGYSGVRLKSASGFAYHR